ncbi:hypothetical protein CDAR_74561 [Caerostris darwini]|uniref:Telomeric repeat-binding factor 2-interacting protein 1 n=1 Tax=Caerostris darwini TaxID=1538125 RepID=A0AAV4P1L0_9ARAC|nr:hypothetical protein CDAR_74561 [Caerostris darwini]
MTDFQHSIVLFCGEDGLPLEFNIRNTNNKVDLRALIEHGGGLCSQSDFAVHLISPGTKVLNADLGKKLVSTRYIFDCVKQNYLLDVNDYIFTVSEASTSDISDEDSVVVANDKCLKQNKIDAEPKVKDMNTEESLHLSFTNSDKIICYSQIQSNSKQNLTSSNTSESFIEGTLEVNSKSKLTSILPPEKTYCKHKPLTSTAQDTCAESIQNNFGDFSNDLSPIEGSQSLVSPLKTMDLMSNCDLGFNVKSQKVGHVNLGENMENPSPKCTVVSSSQPAVGDLDEFDNMLLNKVQQKPNADEEELLSESYKVSSSADAQVGSKHNSEEIFEEGSSAIPDSPMQNCDVIAEDKTYIKNLEVEVQKILQKPSPKSIQDKACLVKYLCCVMKLPPAKVLELLPSL